MYTIATYRSGVPVLVLGQEGHYYRVRDQDGVLMAHVHESSLSNLCRVKEVPEDLLTLTERRVLYARKGKLRPGGVVKALCARKRCRKPFQKKSFKHRYCCRKCQYTAPKEEATTSIV